MRVSTVQQQAMILQDVLNLNQRQVEGWSQVATGQQITQPSQAPGDWTQLQGVRQQISQLDQYINSIDTLLAQLSREDVMLQSYTSYLQDIRSLILKANNGALAVVDLASMAGQVYQWQNAIIGLLNDRDAEGYYLFAGSETSTPPVALAAPDTVTGKAGSNDESSDDTGSDDTSSGDTGNDSAGGGAGTETFVFNTNNDIRQITVASNITMSSTDNAESVCFTINDGESGFNLITLLGQLQETLSEPPVNVATLLAGYLVSIDQTQSQVGSIYADLGTRVRALQGIREDHQQVRIYFQELAGQLGDLDYSGALSQLSLQKVQLEAALKGMAEIDSLSLFNYL